MSLKDIAAPLIARGIRVVPAQPGERASRLPGWPDIATADPAVVEQWDKEYPDWNLVCVADSQSVVIVDFDDLRTAQRMGLPEIPDTFTAQSPRPGYHAYFLPTPRVVALGARTVRNSAGTIAELKVSRASVCAPGCKRADGGEYTIYDESPLVPFPDELADWFELHDPKTVSRGDEPPVSENFDFDEWLDFYQLEVFGGGPWYHMRCPKKGDWHTNKGKPDLCACSIYFDGEFLRFKDQAASCEASEWSIGGLIKFLNEEKGEPYRGAIWSEGIEDDEELDVSQFADDTEPESTPQTTEKCYRQNCNCGMEHTVLPTIPAPEAAPKSEVPEQPSSIDAFLEVFYKLKYPHLRFPYEAMPEGRLKKLVDKTCEGGLSAGLTCPAILSLISSLPHQDVMEGARINLYVCLLAMVGAGKDTAIDRALAVLGMTDGPQWTAYSPSGERSVSFLLADKPATKDLPAVPGHRRHTIVTYELEDTLNKSRGETSSLLQAMQWYYDHNRKIYTDPQRGKTQTVDCRLSWLTALPVGSDEIDEDRFRFAFGDNSSGGFTSRMLFGFAEERFDRRKTRNWEVPYEFHSWDTSEVKETSYTGPVEVQTHDSLVNQLFKSKVEGFAPGVEDLYLDWKPERDISGRDTYHVLKLAVVIAIAYGHALIEQSDWDFAVVFMHWQTAIRVAFAPGKAKTVSQSQFNEVIMREVEKRTEKLRRTGKNNNNAKVVEREGQKFYYVRWKGMANSNRWWRFGMDVEKSVEGLVRNAALVYALDLEPSKDGKDDKLVADKKWVRVQD